MGWTQVTTDPRSKQEIPEAVGVVTSDSLAAESLKGSGSFGEGNPQAAASKQPSKSTTTNNTDISGATTLPPAVDAEAREAQEGWNETAQLKAGQGLGKESGVGPTYNTASSGESNVGAITSATGGVPGTGSTGGTGVPIAPTGSYAGSSELARDPGELKPKGKNITEGGFDTDAPNASFNNAEIGSEDDPGRRAEADMQLRDAAGVLRQNELQGNDNTPYDTLSSEQNA